MMNRYKEKLKEMNQLVPKYKTKIPKQPSTGFVKNWLHENKGRMVYPIPLDPSRHLSCTDKNIRYWYENIYTEQLFKKIDKRLFFNADEIMIQADKRYKVVYFTEGKVSNIDYSKIPHLTTLLCVSSGGDRMNPFVISNQKTLSKSLESYIENDKIYNAGQKSG